MYMGSGVRGFGSSEVRRFGGSEVRSAWFNRSGRFGGVYRQTPEPPNSQTPKPQER